MTAQQSNPDNATTTGQDALWLHEEQVRYARMADEKRTEFRRMVHEQRDWFDAYLGQLLESDRETAIVDVLKTPSVRQVKSAMSAVNTAAIVQPVTTATHSIAASHSTATALQAPTTRTSVVTAVQPRISTASASSNDFSKYVHDLREKIMGGSSQTRASGTATSSSASSTSAVFLPHKRTSTEMAETAATNATHSHSAEPSNAQRQSATEDELQQQEKRLKNLISASAERFRKILPSAKLSVALGSVAEEREDAAVNVRESVSAMKPAEVRGDNSESQVVVEKTTAVDTSTSTVVAPLSDNVERNVDSNIPEPTAAQKEIVPTDVAPQAKSELTATLAPTNIATSTSTNTFIPDSKLRIPDAYKPKSSHDPKPLSALQRKQLEEDRRVEQLRKKEEEKAKRAEIVLEQRRREEEEARRKRLEKQQRVVANQKVLKEKEDLRRLQLESGVKPSATGTTAATTSSSIPTRIIKPTVATQPHPPPHAHGIVSAGITKLPSLLEEEEEPHMFSTTASPVATALTLPSHVPPPKPDTRFTSALMEHIASSPLVAGPLPVKPVIPPPTRIPAVASGAINATADVFKVPMAVDKENKTPSVGSKGSSTPRLSEGFRMSPVVAPTTTATSVEAVKQVRVVQTISAQPSPMSDPSQTIVLKQGGEYLLPAVPSDDDDSDSDEDRRRGTPADKPRLPAWAESPALRQALASQSAADPDAIFGDVAPMRMEEIFTGSSLRRVRPRTSSANWTRDQLTAMETEAYAKYMGFKGKGKDSASASGSAGASGAPK